MAALQKPSAPQSPGSAGRRFFLVAAGLFFFLTVVKFGDPVVLDDLIQAPQGGQAAVFESWPVAWGYWMMLPLVAIGLAVVPWKKLKFKWPLILPAAWLLWQFIAATQSISPELTRLTLEHFSACVILFYLGCFATKGFDEAWPLWTGLGLALCWFMRSGLEQHFGGLEATRQYIYKMQGSADFPPAYLERIASNRIFATFSNPDALAAGIELLLPVTLVFLWQITPKVRPAIRGAFVLILGGCGLACLYWTGSKAGYLVVLVMSVLALSHSTLPLKWKRLLFCAVVVIVLGGIGWQVSRSAKKQKVSVVTRFAYWRAAVKIAEAHPLLGTGPGTFSISYAAVKRPGDDFTRLCHNDYLEEAADSGLPGAISYFAAVFGILLYLYRYRLKKSRELAIFFAGWLGILGLALHSLVDYPVYVPALAWPMFFLLGFCTNFND